MPRMSFREQGIEPAEGFRGDGFIVRPLMPSDVVLDHEAVMSSREFLYDWEQDPPYPPEDFSVADNLEDLARILTMVGGALDKLGDGLQASGAQAAKLFD